MAFYTRSLRNRIFLSMILLVVMASILIAAVTIVQYKEEAQEYHKDRLERKKTAIVQDIKQVLRSTTYAEETEFIPLIFKKEIYNIKDVHNLDLYFYDLDGTLLKSSKASFIKDSTIQCMSPEILNILDITPDKDYVEEFKETELITSPLTVTSQDDSFKPLAILNLPYIEEDGFIKRELRESLIRLGITYLFMLGIAIALAYFLSKYITRSLNTISQKMIDTRFDQRNKRINLDENTTEEIAYLVNAYNGMIDELEISAAQLAASEREAAWREMAKQVAHEIKNPLTPMR